MNKKFDIVEQHYVVYGWMRQGLGLKGSMLELYALVYGYNASGREFTASLEYMCEWTGLSESNVVANLKKLVKGDFLIHDYVYINGHKVGRYGINRDKLTFEIETITPKIDSITSKIGDNNKENKLNNNTNNIEERDFAFREVLKGYEMLYGTETVEAFYRYWSEPTQDRCKMKWELQETWDVGGRLENWSKRDYTKNHNIINLKGGGNTLNSAQNYGGNHKANYFRNETENERRIREEQERIITKYGY